MMVRPLYPTWNSYLIVIAGVLVAHLIFLWWAISFPISYPKPKASAKLVVKSIPLTPRPAPSPQIAAVIPSPQEAPAALPKVEAPAPKPVEKKPAPPAPAKPQPAAAPPKPVEKPKPKAAEKPKPKPKPPEVKKTPEKPKPQKKVETPAPRQPTPEQIAAEKAAKEAAKAKQRELVAKAQENLAKIGETKDKIGSTKTSTLSQAAIPQMIGSLQIDALPSLTEGEGELSAKEISYRDEVAQRLKLSLKLPDYGEVKMKLTVNRAGKVAAIQIISSESNKNKQYIESHVPSMSFPAFGNRFGQASQFSFMVSLRNEN